MEHVEAGLHDASWVKTKGASGIDATPADVRLVQRSKTEELYCFHAYALYFLKLHMHPLQCLPGVN